jgi:hypothetical protein
MNIVYNQTLNILNDINVCNLGNSPIRYIMSTLYDRIVNGIHLKHAVRKARGYRGGLLVSLYHITPKQVQRI